MTISHILRAEVNHDILSMVIMVEAYVGFGQKENALIKNTLHVTEIVCKNQTHLPYFET